MGASLVVELAGRLGVRGIQISSLYMVESLSSHSLQLVYLSWRVGREQLKVTVLWVTYPWL